MSDTASESDVLTLSIRIEWEEQAAQPGRIAASLRTGETYLDHRPNAMHRLSTPHVSVRRSELSRRPQSWDTRLATGRTADEKDREESWNGLTTLLLRSSRGGTG
jgi:hypothetical protein